MKTSFKVIVIMLALIAVSTGADAQKKQKFGHIYADSLMKMMPGYDSAVIRIRAYAGELNKTLEGMNQELQSKVADYQANVNNYTPLIKQTKEKEIQDIQSRVETFQSSADEDLQKKQNQLVKPMADKAKAAIEKVAKENGYTYIFDAGLGVLLFADPTEDIMPLVKTELGIK
jgi:outer membrane protein